MKTLNIKQSCRDCIHFNSEKLPTSEDVCSKLGIPPYQKAPRCFQSHPIHFIRAKVDIANLGKELRHLNHSQLITLANQLGNAAELLAFGFRFGQPVYFNMSNAAYIDNYYKAYVVGCRNLKTKKGEQPVVMIASSLEFSENEEGCYENRALLSLSADSLLTVKEWNEKKAELIAEGRLEQPKPKNGKPTYTQWVAQGKPAPKKDYIDYTPPTIDEQTIIGYWDDFEVSDDIELVNHDEVAEQLETPNKHNAKNSGKHTLEYEETVDEEGNVVRTLKGTSTVNQPAFINKFFDDEFLRF